MATKDATKEIREYFEDPKKIMGDDWEAKLLETSRGLTEPLARNLLQQMALNDVRAERIALLDIACGLGVIGSQVQRGVKPHVLKKSSILCTDVSKKMVEVCQKRGERDQWIGEINYRVVDAQENGLPDNSFTHVTANLGFHLMPDPNLAIKECLRVLKPGGTLGFTTIHEFNPGLIPDVREAFQALGAPFPLQIPAQITKVGRWGDQNWVRKNLIEHGLEDVRVDVISLTSYVKSAQTLVATQSQMMDHVIDVLWDEESRAKFDKVELKQAVVKHCEKKYGGEGWYQAWTMILASGKKRAN